MLGNWLSVKIVGFLYVIDRFGLLILYIYISMKHHFWLTLQINLNMEIILQKIWKRFNLFININRQIIGINPNILQHNSNIHNSIVPISQRKLVAVWARMHRLILQKVSIYKLKSINMCFLKTESIHVVSIKGVSKSFNILEN